MTSNLPLCYRCVKYKDGILLWMCGFDSEGKITSIFSCGNERHIYYLKDTTEVESIEIELINEGWVKLKRPEVTFTFDSVKNKTEEKNKENNKV